MATVDYSKKSDDELCRLFVEKDGLRPDALRALEAELGRRGTTAADHARFQQEEATEKAVWEERSKQKSKQAQAAWIIGFALPFLGSLLGTLIWYFKMTKH